MNRRTALIASTAALLPFGRVAASPQTDVMTRLIEDVIRDGDMSDLDSIVTEDVVIAVLGVTNRDEFEEASVEGHNARDEGYDNLSMTITSMAENGEWVHALVQAEGKEASGRQRRFDVFYVARFRDGLIAQLHFA